jgi:hypothetical protein
VGLGDRNRTPESTRESYEERIASDGITMQFVMLKFHGEHISWIDFAVVS